MNIRYICLILLFLGIWTAVFAQNDVRFLRPESESLTENNIYDIAQDQYGFIWLSSASGLYRYDGYVSKPLQELVISKNILKQEIYRSLLVDKEGYLWFGTSSGKLYRYKSGSIELIKYAKNPILVENKSVEKIIQAKDGTIWIASWGGGLFAYKNQKWTNWKNDPQNENSLSLNEVTCITETQDGSIWAGTWHGGLNQYKDGKFKRYFHDSKNPFSAANNNPRALFEDSRGRLWVGFWNAGLARLESEKFIHYKHDPQNPKSISGEKILSITETPNGIIWVGCWGTGLNAFENDQFTRYLHNPNNQATISADEIEVLRTDKQGNLWIGMHSAGLNRLVVSPFNSYRHNSYEKNGFTGHLVNAIMPDSKDNLWIGSIIGASLLENGIFKTIIDQSARTNLDTNGVLSLMIDKKDRVWMGKFDGGLSLYENGKFKSFNLSENNIPSTATITAIYQTEDGKIYVGVEDQGLFCLENNVFKVYKHHADEPTSISGNGLSCIVENKKDNSLWIGTTTNGLNKFKNGKFERFLHHTNDSNSLSDDHINHLFYSKNGILWIATNWGLNSFDEKANKFEIFNKKNGFPSNIVQSIIEDNSGNLWLGTTSGLVKFNPKTKRVQTFTTKDGLQNQSFNKGAVCKTSDGKLFFGDKGIVYFYPSQITVNSTPPAVVLSDFRIFNHSVLLDTLTSFSKPIHELSEIVLDHTQNVFSFHFSALNYRTSEKNQYSYYLEGFEQGWNEASNTRIATYTNIPSGVYTFRVKASNNDGIWNEEGISIRLVILPPFWKTWWFLTLAFLAVLSLIVAIYKMRVRNLKRQKDELEKQVRIRTAELEAKQDEVMQKNNVLNAQKTEIQKQRDDIFEKSESLTKQKEEIESQRDYILERNAELQQQKEEIESQRDSIMEKNFDLEVQKEEILYQRDFINDQKSEIESLYSNIQAFTLIGQKITSILDLESMITAVYNYVNQFMDASGFGIGIYDEIAQKIEFNGFMEDGKRLPNFHHDLDDQNRFSVWCVKNKKPILMNDVDEQFLDYVPTWVAAIQGKNAQSLIYLPLLVEEKVIGVMTVQSWEINSYQEQHFTMIKGVASYIAIALTNANHYQLLNNAKKTIESKNTQITDSIRYAQTIQEAILPSESHMKHIFGEQNHFVLFKPKDIVSGDFYWAGKIENHILLAVIDCTGHGVPGAFMSMISNTLLDEIIYIEKIIEPVQVLVNLNQKVVFMLKQEQGNNRDGMDIAFLNIHKKEENYTLLFSGAKRPLAYMQQENPKIQVLEGTRKSVGGFQNNKEFLQDELLLKKGDFFYLFTDGFTDQNNAKGVRYGSKTFYEVLENMVNFSLEQQKNILNDSLIYHQAQMEQRDDITVIGIRLN